MGIIAKRARTGRQRQTVVMGWRLANRGPIEVYDDYTDETVELRMGQLDPASIEGLLIDFRYVSRDGELSRRIVLCWQCGSVGDRMYVRGYCPFREELRTFRVDRMTDVIALLPGRDVLIEDLRAYFAAFAANATGPQSLQALEWQEG